jgi:GT2 family glycosyltransferase
VAEDWPAVDIVSLCFNDAGRFAAYTPALARVEYPSEKLRLFVVDNASRIDPGPQLAPVLGALPFRHEIVRETRNLGFGGGCNRGTLSGDAPFVLFLNSDALIRPDTVKALVRRARQDSRAGLVEAAQEPYDLPKWRDPDTGHADWCSGAALLARREAFLEVGMFDPFFFPIYCEDVDLSWRMWLHGWHCIHEPTAVVRHESTEEPGRQKPSEIRGSVRFSFAMHAIYDTAQGFRGHVVRGLRYLISPRTDPVVRRGVREGLATLLRSGPHLRRRRREAQALLARSPERHRISFTEWYYGRWYHPATGT